MFDYETLREKLYVTRYKRNLRICKKAKDHNKNVIGELDKHQTIFLCNTWMKINVNKIKMMEIYLTYFRLPGYNNALMNRHHKLVIDLTIYVKTNGNKTKIIYTHNIYIYIM